MAHSRIVRRLVIGLLSSFVFCAIASPVEAQPRIQAGTLLIASEGLRDPNFRETVVLLFEHGSNGSGGVIVNRPTTMTLRDAFDGGEALQSREDVLWQGGPVLPLGLTAIVRSAPDDEGDGLEIMDGIVMMDPSRALQELDRRTLEQDGIRIFAGHAGWSAGQLEAEIVRGGWKLIPARAEWIFSSDPESLWKTLIEIAGLPAT